MQINKIQIELSFEKNFIVEKITDLADTLSRYIIFKIIFPKSKQWLDEIVNYLAIINEYKIKPNNKKLNKEMYFELLYTNPFIPAPIQLKLKIQYARNVMKESKANIPSNLKEVDNILIDFYNIISEYLVSHTLTKTKIENAIDIMIKNLNSRNNY